MGSYDPMDAAPAVRVPLVRPDGRADADSPHVRLVRDAQRDAQRRAGLLSLAVQLCKCVERLETLFSIYCALSVSRVGWRQWTQLSPFDGNTLIMCMADNGGETDLGGSNFPLRSTKGESFEAIRASSHR